MSVVAFAGRQMAADRAAFNGSRINEVQKLECVVVRGPASTKKFLVGGTGPLAAVMEFREWVLRGSLPRDFPAACRGDNGGTHLVYEVGRGPLLCYGGGHLPWVILEKTHTVGEGNAASYVLGLLDAGVPAGAAMARAVAGGRFDSVGVGVDVFDIHTGERINA